MKEIMEKIIRVIQNNNLFIKVFLVMVISIISVSILITFSTIRMSGALFLETFTFTNTKVLNQVKTKFETFSYSVATASNSAQNNGVIKRVLTKEDLNSIEKATTYHDIIEQMKGIYSNVYPYDANMIIAGKNDELFNMNYSSWPVSLEELKAHPITQEAIRDPSVLLYQFDPPTPLNSEARIVATKALTEWSTDNIYGILFLSIEEKKLRRFYEDYTSKGNDILILNEKGEIVSSNQDKMVGTDSMDLLQYSKEVEDQQLKYKDVNIFGKDYILLSEFLPTFNMYLVNLVDKSIMKDNLINTKEIVFISMGIVLIAIIVVFLISRRMTKSLSKLVKQISNMAKYNFSKPVSETSGYEAKKIANAFNYMLNELQEYVGIVVQTQEKQRDAELRALQHQINPHFLYNTLTTVKFMVQQDNVEKATDTIHALISLLQSAFGNINQTITIEQELINMKNYVFINQGRYGERIKVNYFISPDCLNLKIPKLIIQPFIENSFFHAFNKKKSGYIQILIAQKENRLICEIIDNGDGMETNNNHLMANFKGKRQLFSGIGVKNVHERIQLLYGNNYGVEMSSGQEGTKVKIELPLIEE